jgi:hypothetical protein
MMHAEDKFHNRMDGIYQLDCLPEYCVHPYRKENHAALIAK